MKYLQNRAFSLFEIIVSLIILSIIGIFVGNSFMYIYKDYEIKKDSFYGELELNNALYQIKKILEESYIDSILINGKNNSLKGGSIRFYTKINERKYHDNVMLPCLTEVMNPESIKISNDVISFDFIPLSKMALNCNVYRDDLWIVFIGEDFVFPVDFYSDKFISKVKFISTFNLVAEIPIFLKQSYSKIKPFVYFVRGYSELLFGDSIVLHVNGTKYDIFKKYDDFSILKSKFGFILKLCKDEICVSEIVSSEGFVS